MVSLVDEDDEMDFGEWTLVAGGGRSGRGRSRGEEASLVGLQTSKQSLEENSSDEGFRVMRKKMVREEFKITLKFRKEDQEVQLSPIAVSRELEKKFGANYPHLVKCG